LSLNAAERRVDAGTAAMLINIGPVLVALLAGTLLKEGFPRRLLVGSAIAFSGAMVIGAATSRHGFAPSWGAVLCIFAALFYAAGVLAQKPLLARLPALTVVWSSCVIGATVCVPFAPSFVREAQGAPFSALGWMVYLAVAPMTLGFLTWGYALSRLTAGQTASTTYLVAPISVLLGWLFLGEGPPALAYLGGVLCLIGVAVAKRPNKLARSQASAPTGCPPTGHSPEDVLAAEI
jgi:drug/metabolite transporter (DMT)-like permease